MVATTAIMRSLLSFLLLGLLGLVHALRSSGGRLLVVIEEAAEKEKYTTFWGDLEGGWTALHQTATTIYVVIGVNG